MIDLNVAYTTSLFRPRLNTFSPIHSSPQEKRDTFKKGKSSIIGNGFNRRWFTIERIPNTSNGSSDPSEELALCYYKRSSSDKEQRCGWLFLNDVLSLSQDIPERWITIEHPTRIMRLQSPTPAQVTRLFISVIFSR